MKKPIIFASIGLFVIISASIATSLAWYSSARDAYVEQVLLGIGSDFDFQLSTSGEEGTFYDTLKYDEREVNGMQSVDFFKPISTMFMDTWLESKPTFPKFMDAYNGSTNIVGEPNLPPYTATSEGYYSQEIYIKCEQPHYITIDIDEAKTNFLANVEHNTAVASKHLQQYPYIKSKEEMIERLNNIIYSLRMSILYYDNDNNMNYWIVDPYKTEDTVMAGPLDTTFTFASLDDDNPSGYYSTYFDHDLNDNKEICFGEIYNREKLIYKTSPEQDDSIFSGIPSVFNARHEKGVYALDWEASLENMEKGVDYGIEQSITLEEAQKQVLIPVYSDNYTKIVLSFYLEGWDKDNINETMDAGFDINLAFMIAPVAPPNL